MVPKPEILQVTLAGTTNAVINTGTDDVILGAPGANLRYRIFHVDWSENQNNAANVLRCLLYFGAVGTIANTFASSTIRQDADSWRSWYPQGWPVPSNLGVVNRTLCTVASLNYRVTLHYALEAS